MAPKGVAGLGDGTETTTAQFEHAHSLHNSNFTFFSVFRGVKITVINLPAWLYNIDLKFEYQCMRKF